MRCFFHKDKEACCICKSCGKAMCEDCSATSNHTGYCLSCLAKKYQNRLAYSIITLIIDLFVIFFAFAFDWISRIKIVELAITLLIVLATIFIVSIVFIVKSAKVVNLIQQAMEQGKRLDK